MNEQKRKREILLIIIILAAAALLYLGTRIINAKPARQVEISVDGEVVHVLDLRKDTELTIKGYGGGTNHLVIKDGRIRADEASCPDKVCVNQGFIDRTGQSIVCLPNRMIARIIGE